MRHPAAQRYGLRRLLSPVALAAAVLAALILSILPAASARAASPQHQQAAHARGASAPPKAVIIVGPVEGLTSTYLGYGESWADRAEAQGMDVRRVFSPNATWSKVLENIQGAKLVVFIGHGNGWPSPYGPFQENTKDGFGLNSSASGSHYNVKYYGGNNIRASVHLGKNAIVLFAHACYSPGTGEPWQAAPTPAVARERVENFASGFLTAGAAAYFAYYYEQTRDMVADLYTTDQTLDELFMQPGASDTSGYDGSNAPYYESNRDPGVRIHMDQSTSHGWLRAVAGDLDLTTTEWRGAPPDPDTTAPDMSEFVPVASAYTWTSVVDTTADRPVVFTPNGDGTTDSVNVETTVSEGAYVDVIVRNVASDKVVRKFTSWVAAGTGKVNWDGKMANGDAAADGRYKLTATPKDRAGNVGDSAFADVNAFTSIRSPIASPGLFFSRDGDDLASSSDLSFNLLRPATVSWKLVDTAGALAAVHLDKVDKAAGKLTWTWDGRNDDGSWAHDGLYWSVVTAATDAGTYSHKFPIYQSAFKLYTTLKYANGGSRVTFTITTAEPLSRNPTVTVTQPGLTPFKVTASRMDSTRYKVTITFKTGHPGQASLRVYGYDTNDKGQSSTFQFTVR
jgi:flagellar hook assembly protein FlgD